MTQVSNPPDAGRTGLAAWTAPARRPLLGNVLLGAAAVLFVIPIVALANYDWDFVWPVVLWGGVLSFTALFGGLWARIGEPGTEEEHRAFLRLLGLALGGVAGFATALLGLLMPIVMYSSVFAGGLEVWREHALRLMACALAMFGGLAVMFISLQLGREAERTSAGLRRLVYGYNAVLTGLLLLAVLALVNVLAHVRLGPLTFFSKPWDWTESRLYSIQPATENFLKNLDKPIKVYMLLSPPGLVGAQETETLLDNFKNTTAKVSWDSLSRDLNRKDVEALLQKYQIEFERPGGLLVVYGSGADEQHEFIPYKDLVTINPTPRDETGQSAEAPERYVYKGEAALLRTMAFLAEGKKRAVIYFTQGNGEPSLPNMMAPRGGASLGELHTYLTRVNYDVKELTLTPDVDKVPDDADVVVVAGPRRLPAAAVKALTEYMNPTSASKRKGKLIVLFDVAVDRDREMVTMGLEGLVGQYGVQVPKERIVVLDPNEPTQVPVVTSPFSRNPIAQGFRADNETTFLFDDTRPVEAVPVEGPRGPGNYRAEPILLIRPEVLTWRESNLRDPRDLVKRLRLPDQRQELIAKVRATKRPIGVAVAVVEAQSPLPNIPGHEGMQSKDSVPRMVVFGDAGWITDEALRDIRNAQLFSSCIAWLRGRHNIGVEEKSDGTERKEYTLAYVRTPVMISRLRWTTVGMILLSIVCLGGGIWVVRRR